jgi:uncharacterized protein YuzE
LNEGTSYLFQVATPPGFSVRTTEEVGQGIILIKDARGEVIGFERLYFKSSTAPHELGVVLQTAGT